MKEKKINQPEVRFKEFAGENAEAWEQRKLSEEVASVDTGKSKFAAKESGMYEILGSTSVIGYDDSYDYDGDFLLTARVGVNAGELYRYSGKVKISDNTVFIQGNNLDFIFYALLNFDIKRLSFGTGQPLVKASELKEQKILFPQVEEEKKQIGAYFKHLDNLITLHQRKLDGLKIFKKTMLSKMFPKNGSKVPELRFEGFTEAWEQRKLSHFLETSKEKNSSDYFSKEDVLSVSGDVGIVNQIEFQGRSFAGVSVSNYGVVNIGDVVYTKSPLKANPYGIIKTNTGRAGIVSTLYAVYRCKKNTYPKFVQYYFEFDERLNRYLKPLVNKGAKNDMKVSDDNALNGLVFFPNYVEQFEVSRFLACLDNLITLHQRELENYQTLKKTMLSKMFI